MVNIPALNRIHTLPILVNYHLTTSSSSFTTVFTTPQQVYVHANAASTSKAPEEVETWGSIYLKTVVQGVLLASPELHPSSSSALDTSLYVLDPRETYSRRQRSANFPAHLRSDRESSPAGYPSSPIAHLAQQPATEVWAGKGLLSWALQEAGQGKNLITGRLIRSAEFASVSSGGMGALEALMAADQEEVWGLEVNLSLRTQGMPMTGPLSGMAGSTQLQDRKPSITPVGERRSSIPSEPPSDFGKHGDSDLAPSSSSILPASSISRPSSRPPHISTQKLARPSTIQADNKSTASRRSEVRPRTSSNRKRKIASSSSESERALVELPMNASSSAVRAIPPKSRVSSSKLPSIPAAVYHNPSSLTRDQVHRLLESPAFLDLLEKTARQPVDHIQGAGSSGVEGEAESAAKRVKHEHADDGPNGCLKCYNCGRTKSSVWRMREMEDGNTVKVCNACGLYWNQRKEMRPPSLWGAVDDEISGRRTAPRKPLIPRNPPVSAHTPRAPSTDVDQLNTNPATFKRTLSAVAEQEAKRIASRRPAPVTSVSAPAATHTRSKLHISRTAPATSPAQRTRAKTMRNSTWKNIEGQVASSPGGWVNQDSRAVFGNEAFEPMATIGESPALSTSTTLAFQTESQIQSLLLPLSDDQNQGGNWDTDLSTLFDIDAYSEGLNKDAFDLPSQPLRRSPRKHTNRSIRPQHPNSDSNSDHMSNLFTASSSSTAAASPKSSFDFSALPPSSPPFMMRENTGTSINLGHSALLLSSPEFSPMSSMFGPSPIEGPRLTPEKTKSGLRNGFTSQQGEHLEQARAQAQVQKHGGVYGLGVGVGAGAGIAVGVGVGVGAGPGVQAKSASVPDQIGAQVPMMSLEEITQMLNESGMDQAAWDELFGLMGDADESAGMGVGSVGGGHGSGSAMMMGVGDGSSGVYGGGIGMGMGMGVAGMETVEEDEWTALLNTLGQ